MKRTFKVPTFVKAALVGVLLVAVIVARVHHSGAHARAAQAQVSTRQWQPAPVPYRPARPALAPRNLQPDPAVPFAALAGTNWIKPPPPECKLPFYQLRINPQDLMQLDWSPRSDDRKPATFAAGGIIYDPVGVRYRGDWARSWPKKPLKIFFDKEKPFADRHALNLNSGWRDPAFVREPLAYHVYEVCGVPSPKCRMVRLDVNGQFRGLYVEVEQPDKPLLSRYQLQGATLYKATSKYRQSDERNLGSAEAYAQHYEKETKKTEGFEDLYEFCRELEQTTNAVEFFHRRMDVEKYINYLAASALVQNWDSPNKNHFMVYDGRGSKKWLVVPWDLDRTFGDHWHGYFTETRLPAFLGTRMYPSTTGWNRIMDRFLSEPTLRARFLDRLAVLLEKEFTPEKLFPILDRWESDLATEAAMDRQRWGGGFMDVHAGIAQVKQYIKARRAYLLSEVQSLR